MLSWSHWEAMHGIGAVVSSPLGLAYSEHRSADAELTEVPSGLWGKEADTVAEKTQAVSAFLLLLLAQLSSAQLLIFNLSLHLTCFVFAFTAIWKIETNAPSLAKLTDVDWKKKRWRKYSLGLSFESVNPVNSQGTALWNRRQWFLLYGNGKEPTTIKVSLFKNNAFT